MVGPPNPLTLLNQSRTALFVTAHGITLVELLIAMVIVMTIVAKAIPNLMAAANLTRIGRAVGDIRIFIPSKMKSPCMTLLTDNFPAISPK